MIIEYGIKGIKSVKLEKNVKFDVATLTYEKNYENFTGENFSSLGNDMMEEISKNLDGIPRGSESYVKLGKITIESPVSSFEELSENYKTDLDTCKDILTGKMKGFSL